ncbi:hypothetical protein OIO89_00855 (plasmid) [Mycobacterium ulcerans]|nr:hypothetical protein OIO89_00855 [Mycobacterium ulcerans]
MYVSYGGIQIRPMIPPTFQNSVFSSARQRVYLSATLGAGGELERAFGRAEIVRMPLPTKTPPRSGRRLFIFPDLVKGGDAVGLAKDVVAITNKALVLSQTSSEKTEDAARSLAGRGVAVFGKDSVEHGLAVFAQAPQGYSAWPTATTGWIFPVRTAGSWFSMADRIQSACRRSSSANGSKRRRH